jgi:hypothetical protein
MADRWAGCKVYLGVLLSWCFGSLVWGYLGCYFVEGGDELGCYLGNDCVPSALQQGYSAWDGFGKGETLGGTEDIPANVQATGKPINHMLKNGFNDSLGWDAP